MKHLAVILDGNRRFAKKLMMQPWKGHEWGAKKVRSLTEWCLELDIKELTLYALSIQNLNRPKEELKYLYDLFNTEFDTMINDEESINELTNKGLRVRIIGRRELLPEDMQERIQKIEKITEKNDKYFLNIALAYGAREEIIDAVKSLGKKIESGEIKATDLNEELISKYLYMKDEPDLIIRTGGDRRTSNFLAWQGIYSEWVFLEKTWPEFEKEDLIKCLNDFEKRERRFGN